MADEGIRIIPGNPLDVRPEDLEDLAEDLRRQLPGTPVTVVSKPLTGYGVTFWEVVNIFVSVPSLPHDALVAAVTVVVGKAVAWAHGRSKKSPYRPKYVAIYGPDDEILKAVRVEANGEEIDMTEEKREEEARFRQALDESHKPD